eukprot:3299085-Amphidinium_carterae.1
MPLRHAHLHPRGPPGHKIQNCNHPKDSMSMLYQTGSRKFASRNKKQLHSGLGVHTVWTNGSGRHCSNPHFRRVLEECKPKRFVSDCKGVVSCLHALRPGRRQPKGRHRDLESRALAAFPAGYQIVWMKAHQSDRDADEGRVDRVDLQGNRMADVAANQATRDHFCPRAFRKVEAMEQSLSGCAKLLVHGGYEIACAS